MRCKITVLSAFLQIFRIIIRGNPATALTKDKNPRKFNEF